MACGSLVFKLPSKWVEFYEPGIVAGKHYVELPAFKEGMPSDEEADEYLANVAAPAIKKAVDAAKDSKDLPAIALAGQKWVLDNLSEQVGGWGIVLVRGLLGAVYCIVDGMVRPLTHFLSESRHAVTAFTGSCSHLVYIPTFLSRRGCRATGSTPSSATRSSTLTNPHPQRKARRSKRPPSPEASPVERAHPPVSDPRTALLPQRP